MEGYGIYWFIIEQLAQAGGMLPLKIVPVLAMQSQTQETKVRAVIESYELFQIVDSHFFSIRLNDHLDLRKELSESGKNGAIIRWGNRGANRGANSNPNAKEKKGKEIKEIDNGFFVFFSDNTNQPLGKSQLLRFKNDDIKPEEIIKGKIY